MYRGTGTPGPGSGCDFKPSRLRRRLWMVWARLGFNGEPSGGDNKEEGTGDPLPWSVLLVSPPWRPDEA